MAANPVATQVANPFTAPAASASIAQVAIAQSREVAETQGAIAVAKRFPRDEKAAVDRILMACTRPKLANTAVYTYARGGQDVSGPSIRLAEAIARAWGNFQFGIRELEQRPGESTVEAFAWDVEHNTREVKVFHVAHERHTKGGVKKLTDPRDIYELVANQGARRMRACILGLIPGDVVEAALEQCELTMRADVEVTPELLAKMVEAFQEYGVDKKAIEAKIQRNLDAITPAQVVVLRKVLVSLRDGMGKASDYFDIEPPPPATSEAIDALNAGIARKPVPRGKPTPPAGPTAAHGKPPTFAEVSTMIGQATTAAQLDEIANIIGSVQDDPDGELAELVKIRRELLAQQSEG